MTINNFIFTKIPKIHFGTGTFAELPSIIVKEGKNALIVTGSSSFRSSNYYNNLMSAINELGINSFELRVSGEPSPDFIDKAVNQFRNNNIEVIVGIGGGSAIDTGKAISAMLLQEGSVVQYLEGMETKKHNGIKLPFIAVPTSSGTGSEATKNAVLSKIGSEGFKSSIRHDNFVPNIAILDPALTLSCPSAITAACGLDALTQLIEAYVSTKSSPMTDALILSGLKHFKSGFLNSFFNGSTDINARENMSYASLISGIALANAGLGVVHGFASSIGGYFDIPHGVICGTLLAEATKINIEALLQDENKNKIAIEKYAQAGVILSNKPSTNIINDCRLLVETLQELINITSIPALNSYGISESDIPKIINKTSNKNSPVLLNKEQLISIIKSRI